MERSPNKQIYTGLAVIGVLAVATGIALHETRHTEALPHQGTLMGAPLNQQVDLSPGTWRHLPGATPVESGLAVAYTDMRIVDQDGGGGQPNPPVNYSQHLEVSGDFSVHVQIDDIKGGAELGLYGTPPIIQDEFRVEGKSLRLAFYPGDKQRQQRLEIQEWEGLRDRPLNKQDPVFRRSFSFQTKDPSSIDLAITRTNGLLDIDVNGNHVGAIRDRKLFDSGNIYFGASARQEHDRFRLSKLGAVSFGKGSVKVRDLSSAPAVPLNPEGLQALASAKRPGLIIGSAVQREPLFADSEYRKIALENFGGMTLTEALKWQFVRPRPDVWTFQEADALIEQAEKQGMKVHAHAIFGEALPRWISDLPTETAEDKARVKQVFTETLAAMVTRYNGRVHSWDLNELLADYDEFENGQVMRENIWYRAMGDEYPRLAAQIIRDIDPNAKIIINEFGTEARGERREALKNLLVSLGPAGEMIDGVGLQSHIYEKGDGANEKELEEWTNWLRDNGYEIRFSELDVTAEAGPAWQAEQYSIPIRVCLKNPACTGVTVWGFHDRYNQWQDDHRRLQQGEDLLWQRDGKPTEAVTYITRLLKQ